jgi:hypothetical protein
MRRRAGACGLAPAGPRVAYTEVYAHHDDHACEGPILPMISYWFAIGSALILVSVVFVYMTWRMHHAMKREDRR